MRFGFDDAGIPTTELIAHDKDFAGFLVQMSVEHEDAHADLASYFESFILSSGIEFIYNGNRIAPRSPSFQIASKLTTERFLNGKWDKPTLATSIELYPTNDDEIPLIYEMGIPVCPIEWTTKHHACVKQRIPMNPNRDAVLSGYLERVRRACLPTLLPVLDQDTARESWVGDAAAKINDSVLQKEVIEKAFGQNIARSVPPMGKFDYDQSAREEAAVNILHTVQLTGGFRDLVRQHVPSSKDVAAAALSQKQAPIVETPALTLAEVEAIDPQAPTTNPIVAAILGQNLDTVIEVLKFSQRLSQAIMQKLVKPAPQVIIKVGLLNSALGRYSSEHEMQLNIAAKDLWLDGYSSLLLETIIHELAHELAMHHGDSFNHAMQLVAGLAGVMLYQFGYQAGKDFYVETSSNA